jgi:hypothetical protein
MIASKREIDKAAQSFSLDDREHEFDHPQTTTNLTRKQRIIDISNGITPAEKEIFTPSSESRKGGAQPSAKFSNLSNLFATTADSS